jgi:hypothetical protein
LSGSARPRPARPRYASRKLPPHATPCFTAAVSGSRSSRGWAFYPTGSASGLRLWAQTAVVNIGTDLNLLKSHSEQILLSGGDRELERRSRDARETQSAPVYRTVLVVSTPRLDALTRSAASVAFGHRSVSVAPCLALLVRALLVHDTRHVSYPPMPPHVLRPLFPALGRRAAGRSTQPAPPLGSASGLKLRL